jgi:hypothetical protein
MRQEARIRPQRALVEEEDQPPLEPEHPTGTRDRVRQPQAAQCLHLVHQGRQGNPLTYLVRSGPVLELLAHRAFNPPPRDSRRSQLIENAVLQAWMTTGMIIGRRRWVSLTHLPSCRRITC